MRKVLETRGDLLSFTQMKDHKLALARKTRNNNNKDVAIVGYLMPNPLYTYISNIYDLFGWVLWHINHFRLFNAKSSILNIFL